MHVWIIHRALGTTKSPSYVISNQKCNIPRLVFPLMLPPGPSEIKPVAYSVASIAPNYSFTVFSILHSGSKTWRPKRDMRTLPWTSMLKSIAQLLDNIHAWKWHTKSFTSVSLSFCIRIRVQFGTHSLCSEPFFFLLNVKILMAYVSLNWKRNFCFRGVISYSLSFFPPGISFVHSPFFTNIALCCIKIVN